MLYVLHHDEVVCAALDFTPYQPSNWRPGHIVHFSAAHAPLPKEVEYAILMSLSGSGWHLEILAVTPPVDPESQARAGVTARILRSLKGDDETMGLISAYASEMTRLSRTLEKFPSSGRQGAA